MTLFRHSWKAADNRATIVLVHGAGEHHARYEHVARYLNEHGYSVITGDLPGFGRSEGLKGHIEKFDDYLDAVGLWMDEARRENVENKPLFLLGHSLGGLIATRFVQRFPHRHELAGLILSSPLLQVKLEVPNWKISLAGTLNRLWPTLRLPNEIAPSMVSRHEVIRAQYRSDPYNYSRVSVRWFNEMHNALKQAWQEFSKVDIPLLVMQAGDDSIINPEAVERFVQQAASTDKKFISFPGLYHEIFNEPEREEVLQALVKWLDVKTSTLGNVTY